MDGELVSLLMFSKDFKLSVASWEKDRWNSCVGGCASGFGVPSTAANGVTPAAGIGGKGAFGTTPDAGGVAPDPDMAASVLRPGVGTAPPGGAPVGGCKGCAGMTPGSVMYGIITIVPSG